MPLVALDASELTGDPNLFKASFTANHRLLPPPVVPPPFSRLSRLAMSTPRIAMSTPRIAMSTPRTATSPPRTTLATPSFPCSPSPFLLPPQVFYLYTEDRCVSTEDRYVYTEDSYVYTEDYSSRFSLQTTTTLPRFFFSSEFRFYRTIPHSVAIVAFRPLASTLLTLGEQ